MSLKLVWYLPKKTTSSFLFLLLYFDVILKPSRYVFKTYQTRNIFMAEFNNS